MIDYVIYLIALILAIDCFVVSIAIASSIKINKKEYFRIPFHFGLFQGGMTLLGFYLGLSFLNIIETFDHWIVFGLLFLIGTKMIIDSFKREKRKYGKLSYWVIIILSIAISIDALAIGVSFSIVGGAILMKALIIGFLSLILSLIGLSIGKKLTNFKLHYLGIIGGLVLISIGIKILFEHLR